MRRAAVTRGVALGAGKEKTTFTAPDSARSTSNGRFLSATSQALLYIVAVAVCLVALASFALSFNALAELAVASHIPAYIGWAWPVVVDASIIIATFASLVLRGRSTR